MGKGANASALLRTIPVNLKRDSKVHDVVVLMKLVLCFVEAVLFCVLFYLFSSHSSICVHKLAGKNVN